MCRVPPCRAPTTGMKIMDNLVKDIFKTIAKECNTGKKKHYGVKMLEVLPDYFSLATWRKVSLHMEQMR